MKKFTPAEWDAMEAQSRRLSDPALREFMLKTGRREREQAEALERAAKMKRPSGHTPAVQRVYELVASHPGMYPAELWDKFGADPKLIGLSESNFKRRASEARTEIRKSVKTKNK